MTARDGARPQTGTGSWGLGLRARNWELGAGDWEESQTGAVDVKGKRHKLPLLQTDTDKGSGSLGGIWRPNRQTGAVTDRKDRQTCHARPQSVTQAGARAGKQ